MAKPPNEDMTRHCLIGYLNQYMYIGQCVSHYSIKCQSSNDQSIITCIGGCLLGVSNGPIQFESARKSWPFLALLTKLT